MKPLKTAGIVVLLLVALAAAYYSYSQTYGYMPPSSSGGPPAGIKMPAMSGRPGKTAPAQKQEKPASAPKNSQPENPGQTGTSR
jgi:hypothetical protein